MSEWIDASKDDLSFSDDGKELLIWIKDNYQGNVYVSIPMEFVLEKYQEVKK